MFFMKIYLQNVPLCSDLKVLNPSDLITTRNKHLFISYFVYSDLLLVTHAEIKNFPC